MTMGRRSLYLRAIWGFSVGKEDCEVVGTMMLYMMAHWIFFIAAVTLGGVEVGRWFHAQWNAQRELKDRGWVCIDLPSPDTVPATTQHGQRPFLAYVMSAAVPVLGAFAVLTAATCMLLV